MRSNSLLVLTLAVVALGAFIFFYEKDLPSTDERRELDKKLFDLEKDEIEGLRLEADGQIVDLERQARSPEEDDEDGAEADQIGAAPTEWRLREPFDSRADPTAVDTLLTQLTSLEKERTLSDLSRTDAGLDEPRAVVSLRREDGEQTVLEIGSEVPASSQMLVAVRGRDEIYLVERTLFEQVIKEPGSWRDRRLFAVSRGDIEALRIEHRESAAEDPHRLRLARRGEAFWLEEPFADRADEEAVNGLLTGLTGLTASAFVDDPLLSAEKVGLEPPLAVIEAELGGTSGSLRLEIGDATAGGQRYARAGGQVVEIAPDLHSALVRPAEAWRARSLAALQVFSIDRVEIEDDDGTVVLSREGADWRRDDERIPYAAASDFLYAVTEIEAERVIDRQRAIRQGQPLANPYLTIRLTGKDGTVEELEIFAPVDEGTETDEEGADLATRSQAVATASGREPVLLIPDSALENLELRLTELRVAEPLAEEPEEGAEADS